MIYDFKKVLKMAEKNMAGLIFNSELSFTSQLSFLASKIADNVDCNLLLIVGPSSSGKTTFSNLLSDRLQYLGIKTHTISTDDFFIDRDKVPVLPSGLKDFDSLAAIDIDGLKSCIRSALNGDWFETPSYDFLTGKSIPRQNLHKLHKEDIVVLEGIHSFNPILFDEPYDERIMRVSISPSSTFDFGDGLTLESDDLRLLRRTIRDYNSRGHDFSNTISQWQEVRAAEDKYIKPYLINADYRVDTTYEYELFAYKHCIYESLKAADHDGYQHIVDVLDKVPYLPLTSIPGESLLNEFVHFVK